MLAESAWSGFFLNLGAWLATFVVQSTLFVVLAALVCRALRRKGLLALEDLLWRVAFVAPFVSTSFFTWQSESATLVFRVETPSGTTSTAEMPVATSPRASLSEAAVDLAPEHELAWHRPADLRSEAIDVEPPASRAKLDTERTLVRETALSSLPDGVPAGILLALGGASALALLSLGVRALALYRMLGRRRRITSGPYFEIVSELCRRARIARVRLSTSRDLQTPVALLGREVCLPEWMLDADAGQLRATIAHELAHVARRDPAWLSAALVTEALFVFQPLLGVARRRWQATSEYLCDDWAVELTGSGLELAKSLTEVLTMQKRGTTPLILPAMLSTSRPLRERVARLLAPSDDRRARKVRRSYLGVTLAGAFGVALIAPIVITCAPHAQKKPLAPVDAGSSTTTPVAKAAPSITAPSSESADPAQAPDTPFPSAPEAAAPEQDRSHGPSAQTPPTPPTPPAPPPPPVAPPTVPSPPPPPVVPDVSGIVAEVNKLLPKAQAHAEELRRLGQGQQDTARELKDSQQELERLKAATDSASVNRRNDLKQRTAALQKKMDQTGKLMEKKTEQFEKEMEAWQDKFEERMDSWGDDLSEKFEKWGEQFEKSYAGKLETWKQAHGRAWEDYAEKMEQWGEKLGDKWQHWGEHQAERVERQHERAERAAERAKRAVERIRERPERAGESSGKKGK